MSTDFHYVPLAPEALSGSSFISQTEQAINELGTQIDTTNNTANNALDTANSALATANTALGTANDAFSSAQNAQDAADRAKSAADVAQVAAENAHDRANSAYDLAASADSKADTAQNASDAAQRSADAAQNTADTAQSTADASSLVASAANELATNALGKYIVTTGTGIDADTYYSTPNKLFLTDSDIVNFPVDAPLYFEVLVDSYTQAVTQRAWTVDDPTPWQRGGTIDKSDPENLSVTWSSRGWIQQASNVKTAIAHSFSGERQEAIAAGSAYAVPEYKAGYNHLEIYLNGVRCIEGSDAATASYTETGEPGSGSTNIVWHQDIDTSYNITVIAHQSGHGGSAGGNLDSHLADPNAHTDAITARIEDAVAALISQPTFQLLEFYSFRNPTLQPGFYPRYGGVIENAATLHPEAWAKLQTTEGRQLCVTEAEWQAMSTAAWHTLADGTKIGWNGIGGVPFYAPNWETGALRLPDTRGMYSEDAGFDGLGVGSVHGDAIRHLKGNLGAAQLATGYGERVNLSGVFSLGNGGGAQGAEAGGASIGFSFDASRVAPTGNAAKPRAFGVLPCIYLGTPK